MRVVYALVLIVLVLALVGFVHMNPDQRVRVKLFDREYQDVALFWVAFFAFAVGVGFTALVALIEGATIRFSNRRLRRRIRQLESERSLATAGTRTLAESVPDVGPAPARTSGEPAAAPPASAPVYHPEATDDSRRGI
jgi:hypothetical protein